MKKKKVENLTTRHNEVKIFTAEPREMLNKYLVQSVYRTWNEDFVDEDTGEVVSIERRELLSERGSKIDQDLLAKLQFSLQAKEMEGVHISNQKRQAYEIESNRMNVWVAKVEVETKGSKYLFYSNNITNSIEIVRDFIEQKKEGSFNILECKEFVRSIILEDTLESTEDTPSDGGKKFLQIDTTVSFEDAEGMPYTFIVHTNSIEKAMIVIEHYINQREEEVKDQNQSNKVKYIPRAFKVCIEKAAPIPIGTFIPQEFSEAYCKES